MDNLAHTLLGVHLARLPPLERAGPRVSMVTAIVASNLPDADILLRFWGESAYVFGHRTATHSLLGIAVLAPLVAGIAAAFARRPWREAFPPLFLLSVVCLLGHLLLDIPTSWGTAVLWPFSERRITLPWMFIIDPIVILLLGAPLLRDLARRRAGRPMQAARTGALAIASLLLYTAVCGNLHARAAALALDAAASGRELPPGEPPEVRAYPAPFGPLLWTTAVRTDVDVWHRGFTSVLTGGVTPAGDFPTGLTDSRVQVALETGVGRSYAAFAGALYLVSATPLEEDGSFEVLLGDLRFTTPFADAAPFQLWLRVGPRFREVAHELRTGSVPPEPDVLAARTP